MFACCRPAARSDGEDAGKGAERATQAKKVSGVKLPEHSGCVRFRACRALHMSHARMHGARVEPGTSFRRKTTWHATARHICALRPAGCFVSGPLRA